MGFKIAHRAKTKSVASAMKHFNTSANLAEAVFCPAKFVMVFMIVRINPMNGTVLYPLIMDLFELGMLHLRLRGFIYDEWPFHDTGCIDENHAPLLDKYQSRYSLCTLYYNYVVVQVPHVCLCLCFLEKYGHRVEKEY